MTKIGLRSTRMMTRDDVEITVPNAAIASGKIINESGGPSKKSRVSVGVGVAYGSDVDQVREVLLRAAQGVEFVVDDPEPRIRFTEMADSALVFSVLCWIEFPELRGQCVDGLNTAIYKALNAEGITIPFPQRGRASLPGHGRDSDSKLDLLRPRLAPAAGVGRSLDLVSRGFCQLSGSELGSRSGRTWATGSRSHTSRRSTRRTLGCGARGDGQPVADGVRP